ncbi:MAG: helix-turn-helix transcriptional regulator [Candidatus Sedimenticola sp. 20ELBAFRAG]
MHNSLSVELRSARKASGFLQKDLAQLLGVQQSKISQYEAGKRIPDRVHFLKLAIIYGSAFEQFQAQQLKQTQQKLLDNLGTLPTDIPVTANTYNRLASLEHLRHRLLTETTAYDPAA